MRIRALVAIAAVVAVGWVLSGGGSDEPTESDTVLNGVDFAPPTAPPDIARYAAPGLTLFPGRVTSTTEVEVLVDGTIFESPTLSAASLDTVFRGDILTAVSELDDGGFRWIEVDTGFLPASLLDYPARRFQGVMEEGTEGLIAGWIVPRSYEPPDLVDVPAPLLHPFVTARTIRLRAGALAAFRGMFAAAKLAGIDLRFVSGYRGADYQARLYATQLVAKGYFQNVSAPPGRSEHQLGTTADLGSPGEAPLRLAFGDSSAGNWLAAHCNEFGIVLSFSIDRHRSRRVSYEPWHLRWVGTRTSDDSDW